MRELKKLLIDWLCSEYSRDEAISQINEATLIIKGSHVTIEYANGKKDCVTIETVSTERVVQINELIKNN